MGKSIQHKKTKIGRDVLLKQKRKQRQHSKLYANSYHLIESDNDVELDDYFLDQLNKVDDTLFKYTQEDI